jgi:hypothetical protein
VDVSTKLVVDWLHNVNLKQKNHMMIQTLDQQISYRNAINVQHERPRRQHCSCPNVRKGQEELGSSYYSIPIWLARYPGSLVGNGMKDNLADWDLSCLTAVA